MKVAIIGSKDWQSRRKIQEVISRLKQMDESVTILGQGGKEGAPLMVKKYALEFNMNYVEFNPSYTGRNLYSAIPDGNLKSSANSRIFFFDIYNRFFLLITYYNNKYDIILK